MKLPVISLPDRISNLRFDVPIVADARFAVQAAGKDDAVIEIFDVIGGEVTAGRVSAALRQIGARSVTVKINSPGGSYFEGATIFNVLRQHPGTVTTQILGIAASAASIVAMAGEEIQIARNAQIMVHQAQGIAIGPAEIMIETADLLAKVDEAIAETYALRTGLPEAKIAALMAAETFMAHDQAIALGFADKLLDRDADPKPRVSNREGPANKLEFANDLRRLGLPKAAAKRAAAAGWAALSPDALDPEPIAAVLREQARQFSKRFAN